MLSTVRFPMVYPCVDLKSVVPLFFEPLSNFPYICKNEKKLDFNASDKIMINIFHSIFYKGQKYKRSGNILLPEEMSSYTWNKIIFGFHVTSFFQFKASFHREMLRLSCTFMCDPLQKPLIAFITTWHFQSDHIMPSVNKKQ